MCGIAGIVGAVQPGAVERMISVMQHRGPDGHGAYVDAVGGCQLGHARLAIIDTSSAAAQPMQYAGRFWITYNGEVYNYRELRAELEGHGRAFMTHSDTEVVLAAYAEWGAGCVSRLSGMFAFAIWDSRRQELFLARDRLGIKPLYVTSAPGPFLFASELRGLLASGSVKRTADGRAICDFLSLGAVPQPRTILADVQMLLPGHHAVLRDGRLVSTEYWSYREPTRSEAVMPAGLQAQAGKLRQLLEAATARHLVADVPVGAFLSGGVDSRIVVGLMSRVARERIRTFTLGFEAAPGFIDEREAARDAAQAFGCIHTEMVLTPSEAIGAVERILGDVDQPSVDGFNTWFVARMARERVTVALSGLGGDELFGGYGHFQTLVGAGRLAPDGVPWLRPLAALLAKWPPRRVGRALERLAADRPARISTLRRLCRDDEKHSMLQPGLAETSARYPVTDYCRTLVGNTGDLVNDLCFAEVTGYLRSTLLRDADAMSMAHSLELRPVLLDHEVVEFAASLPGESKVGGGLGKKVLIAACRDLLPVGVANATKRGFEIPIVGWLGPHMSESVKQTLSGQRAESVFTRGFLERTQRAVGIPGSRDRSWWPAFLLLDYLERHGLRVAA